MRVIFQVPALLKGHLRWNSYILNNKALPLQLSLFRTAQQGLQGICLQAVLSARHRVRDQAGNTHAEMQKGCLGAILVLCPGFWSFRNRKRAHLCNSTELIAETFQQGEGQSDGTKATEK